MTPGDRVIVRGNLKRQSGIYLGPVDGERHLAWVLLDNGHRIWCGLTQLDLANEP